MDCHPALVVYSKHNSMMDIVRGSWLLALAVVKNEIKIEKTFIYFITVRSMIQQFHRILKTPKQNSGLTLSRTQDLILSSFEKIFPQSFDLQFLHKIYEEILGPDAFPGTGEIQVTIDQQISLNYRLVEYFVMLIKQNFVNLDVYRALEEQTQKAEATIRSHIKIEQQMKMYLEYMQSKIDNLTKALHISDNTDSLRRDLLILQGREAALQKQKINLIKKNERLNTQLQTLTHYISSMPTSPNNSSLSQSNPKRTPHTYTMYEDSQKQLPEQQNDTYLPITETKSKKQYDVYNYKDMEKEGFRSVNGSYYEVTQKKRSNYFPGNGRT